MTTIQKTDIVGARIREILFTQEISDGGLDCITIYFSVDRGFAFTMPFGGSPWESVEIPCGAKPLTDHLPRKWWHLPPKMSDKFDKIDCGIKNNAIAGVFGDPKCPDDTVLVLDDGSQVSNTMVAPHGTGAAGLYYAHTKAELRSLVDLVDFFDIRVARASNDGQIA